MAATSSSSANLPDLRVTALLTARAMYPAASVAEQIAVAEYLLRAAPIPVYPPVRYDYPGGWYPPLQITCDTRPPYLAIDTASGKYVASGGAGGASVFTITTPRGRDDDDGTAGVLAKVG